jgi:hypothetical protein
MDVTSLVAHQLKYLYKKTPLPDGKFDWLPILPVQVGRSTNLTSPFEAIVDSGSFDCLFHADIARAVGIKDITTGVLKTSGGVVGGAQMQTYGHEVRLIVGSDNFKIEAYFAENLPIAALLGRNGFFDKYIVTFDPQGATPGFDLTRVHQTKK